jgi:hypothetical protein
VKAAFKKYPEIAEAYSIYVQCRGQHVTVYKSSKGKDTFQKLAPFTMGLMQLPDEGGLLDQSHRLMTFFDEFIDGERQAFFNPRR